MFGNQQNNNMYQGTQFAGGGSYYTPPKKVEMHQALTAEEEQLLKQNNKSNISFKLDQLELLTGICTHKSNTTKMPDITLLGGTRVRCNICQKEWDLIDDPELFKSALGIVISGLQTIKTWWIDIPPEMAREYFPIIPLLEKAPAALQMAMQCWRSYEEARQVNNTNGVNSFNVWEQVMSGAYNNNQQNNNNNQMMAQMQSMMQAMMANQQQNNTYNGNTQMNNNDFYQNNNNGGGNPLVQDNANNGGGFVNNPTGFAPGMTGNINNMGQERQTTVTNTVEVKKTIGL